MHICDRLGCNVIRQTRTSFNTHPTTSTMDSLFAIKGKDFVLVAADAYAAYSIIRLTNKEDKLKVVDGTKVLALAGPVADRNQFGNFMIRNIHLEKVRRGIPLSTHAAASCARSWLSDFLRENPHQVDMLVAGVEDGVPQLYWIDFLASMVELPKAAHGYGSHFLLGLLDRYYKPDLTEEEAIEICHKCIQELKERFLLSQAEFVVKIVKKEGVETVTIPPPPVVVSETSA